MEYTLNGQDIVNIYNCLTELDKSNLIADKHQRVLQQMQHYLHFFCTTLIEKVRMGDQSYQVQFSSNQVTLLSSLLEQYIRDLQWEYDNFDGMKSQQDELANDIIAYNLTFKKIHQLTRQTV